MTPDTVLDIGQRALAVTTVLGAVILLAGYRWYKARQG